MDRAPNLDCVAQTAQSLANEGLEVTHMVSLGGWAGPHPLPTNDPTEMYQVWKNWNENVVARPGFEQGFAGIDWDMEGNNTLSSIGNYFTVSCLDAVGKFSQMAKQDGYRVSLVPPQSYYDGTASWFNRYLNNSYPDYQESFRYHGYNSYAYLVSRYGQAPSAGLYDGPTFDWVAVQLYESYSRALQAVVADGQPADAYLTDYIKQLQDGWTVDFGSDKAINWPSQHVSLNKSQVVIGLANGWTDGSRAILIAPDLVGKSYTELKAIGREPRGYAFWDIGDEGVTPAGWTSPLYLAKGLNDFLHIRST